MKKSKTGGKESRRPPRTDARSKLAPFEEKAAFLEDIIIYGEIVLKLARGMNLATFVQDDVKRKAMIYDLQSVGEAIKMLDEISPEVLERHPEVQWDNLAGFRIVATHKYWEVDHALVWDSIKRYLEPAIRAAVMELAPLLPVLP